MAPLRIILITVLVTALSCPVAAAPAADAQASYDNLNLQYNQARSLALTILREIKQIDGECRDGAGNPLPTRQALAREKLGKVELLQVSFATADGEAAKLLTQLEADRQSLPASDPLAGELGAALPKIRADLDKYRRYVARYYDKAVADFGRPTSRTTPRAVAGNTDKLRISGEVTGGVGNAKYERINANPATKASTMDMSFGLKGLYLPTERTDIQAYASHHSTVQRREIGLTNLGANVTQQFTPNLTATAGLDIASYSDKEVDEVNYRDVGLFARMAYLNEDSRFDFDVKRVKRSYPNAPDNAFIIIPDLPPRFDLYKPEYSTTSLAARATVPLGEGQLKAQLQYFKKTVGNKFFDFNEFSPSAVWTISPSGSEAGVSFQKFTHPNQDSAVTDNNRIKVHYYNVTRTADGSVSWGPEAQLYRYPMAEEQNYSDIKFMRRADSRGQQLTTSRWEIAYRLYSDSLQFDFAQLQYRKNSRPIRAGRYSNMNLAARYYTEASDEDDSLRFTAVHPAHTLDVYWEFGWSKPGTSWVRRLTVGPILAARMFFDTERADAFDEDFVDVDFVLRNPRNSARAGLKLGLSGASAAGVTWRADASYIYSMLYNADPIRSTNILEISTQATYPINDLWLVEGYGKLHRTRAEVESAADLNKLDVGIRATYLFDLAR